MRSLHALTNREWNQIRAALRFWSEVAAVSAKHPAQHPRVAEMFDRYAPLTIPEVEALVDHEDETPLTLKDAAKRLGIGQRRASNLVQEHNVQPVIRLGRACGYRLGDLRALVE